MNNAVPKIAIIVFRGTVQGPSPIYLFALINKSTNKEYPVKDLCTQQKWNTSDSAKINIEGNIEHPTIVSAIINSKPKIANIVYPHIAKNIITGMYFKHNIAILWSFFKVFIYCIFLQI